MSADRSAPLGLALIVCDQVIEDKLTSKKSLIGTFNNIASTTFPCRPPQISVFVALTEGQGRSAARLRIVNTADDAVVTDVSGAIEFADKNAVVEMVFNFVGLTFPAAGLYAIEFHCDDELILERRFHISQLQTQPPPAESAT